MTLSYAPPDHPVPIVYLDESLVIADKPSGLLSVPGRGPEKADCLVWRLQKDLPQVLIVHRLDMETSGLMILARTAEVHKAMSKQFENREISKTYMARVAGVPGETKGRIDLPLSKDWPNRPLQKVDVLNGKPSVTVWQLISAQQASAELKLTPLTGRTHQLRVHLNAIGHPILGDTLYGTPASQSGATRLQLHASALSFAHPLSGEKMMLQSCAPF